MAQARAMRGNEGLEKIYFAVAGAYHDEGRDLEDETTLTHALRKAGMSEHLLAEIRENTALDKELDDEYERACSRGVFGVPSLFIDGDEVPYFGPVIDRIDSEEEACGLWDLILGLTHHDYFYELKRPRI
jgi:2-hydroxychromene-2-carboxylate isomerase